jgi:hypothetical protein
MKEKLVLKKVRVKPLVGTKQELNDTLFTIFF